MVIVTQLSPSIPLDTPKGPGLALFYIWLSEEHHGLWVVCIDSTGEFWTYENPQVRGTKSVTFGRIVDNKHLKEKEIKPDSKADIGRGTKPITTMCHRSNCLGANCPDSYYHSNIDLGGS